MNVSDSITVITGASRGIGLALTRQLIASGGHVVMVDVDGDALDRVQTEISSERVATVKADVRIRSELAKAIKCFGGCNVWINNAGLARHRPVSDYTEEDLDLMMDVNLKGTTFGSQIALEHFTSHGIRGHILNVISTASLRGIPTESFYCATKWAVRGFTQALAEEAAPYGVKVTGVLPGGVNTAFWDDAVNHQMPVEDFLSPDQVAAAMVSAIGQDESVVTRELVLRAINDRDFAQ